MSMNPDIKARWVAALRSGNYAKGIGHLRMDRVSGRSEYCCLGVLCEIAVEDGVAELLPVHLDWVDRYYRAIGTDIKDSTILPAPIAAWAGLTAYGEIDRAHGADCPNIIEGEEECEEADCVACRNVILTELNDSGRYNFNQIADVIDKWL